MLKNITPMSIAPTLTDRVPMPKLISALSSQYPGNTATGKPNSRKRRIPMSEL
jgi:hypothetical protein